MDFDSLFDDAMKVADQAIEDAMASEFHLLLGDGSNLDTKALFDTELEFKGGDNVAPFMCEQGALTVLNQRVDKALVKGATVLTPIGLRAVFDVFYPDATTSVLQLSVATQGSTGGHHGRFVRTGG